MENFYLALPIMLALGVVFVNGFTDAPNAIATAVAAKALSLRNACLLCGIFNLLGCFFFSLFSGQVIDTIFSIINLENTKSTYLCVISGLFTTILFGIIAWLLKMPSSESHALICSLLGATLVFGKGSIVKEALYIIICMIASCLLSFLIAFFIGRRNKNEKRSNLILTMCLLSAMHGAQDGQKFIASLMFLGSFMHTQSPVFEKLPLSILVSVFMLLGSLLGGKRIIETIGEKTSKINYSSAFSSDLSSILTICACSLFGLPVSTGNIRIFSIIGAGVSIKQPINKKTAGLALLISVLTLPFCFFIGYIICYMLQPIQAMI
ncbi:MAG: inorganic phosphate transporter [Clostridia bacterium]|nr:inorganic phosphate transporter [Clostridia bacterium]